MSNTSATPPLGHLIINSQRLLSASLASNSQMVYENALLAFKTFRQNYNFPYAWPAPVEHVILFISYCFDLGYSPSTITTYISGVGFYYKLRNMKDPTAAFIIKKMLEGCKRSRPRKDVRAPITEAILQKICLILPNICYSPYENYLFRAAYLTAYFGLLRVSELVFTSPIQAQRPLLFSDVQIVQNPKALVVSIRASKSNQAGPPTVIRIPLSGHPSMCCVLAVQHYLRIRPPRAQYFFCHANGAPLTRSQFSGVLSKAIRNLGLPAKLYTSHSFRIGRASDLSFRGVSNDIIKKLGRWRSNAVDGYIRN